MNQQIKWLINTHVIYFWLRRVDFSSSPCRVLNVSCPLTWLLFPLAGVGEGSSLCGLPVTDGLTLRSVRLGEAAGVSERAAAVTTQLNWSPPRPPHFESWRWLLWRREAPDAWLRSFADVYRRPALPCSTTEVQSLSLIDWGHLALWEVCYEVCTVTV